MERISFLHRLLASLEEASYYQTDRKNKTKLLVKKRLVARRIEAAVLLDKQQIFAAMSLRQETSPTKANGSLKPVSPKKGEVEKGRESFLPAEKEEETKKVTIISEYDIKKSGHNRRVAIELHSSEGEEQVFLRISKKQNFSWTNPFGRSSSVISNNSIRSEFSEEISSVVSQDSTNYNEYNPSLSSVPEKDKFNDSVVSSPPRTPKDANAQWIARYLLPLDRVQITSISNKRVTLLLTYKENRAPEERHFVFASTADAHSFKSTIEEQAKSMTNRTDQRLLNRLAKANLKREGNLEQFKQEKLELLVEIVGCEGLPAADITTSDPFVKVIWNNKLLHRTKFISKNLNPVFTLRKECFFLWKVDAQDLFLKDNGEGLKLVVLDFDAMGSSDVLCAAKVPPGDIYKSNEEHLTFDLNKESIPEKIHSIKSEGDENERKNLMKSVVSGGTSIVKTVGSTGGDLVKTVGSGGGKLIAKAIKKGGKKESLGKISIRVRRATESDKKFMAEYEEYKEREKFGAAKVLHVGGKIFKKEKKKRGETGRTAFQSMVETKQRTFLSEDKVHKVVKYKAMPCPDPKNVEETEWLSATEIEKIVMEPSRKCKHFGSGKLAKIFLEILSCDDLPNMEGPLAKFGNKTDAFAQIVYEDVLCKTDIIDDHNSPRFLPWCNRAFCLYTDHPSSTINIGIFDFDAGNAMLNDHDLIGRISVDVMNLRPGTEYVLNYKLWNTSIINEGRKHQGEIKIRIRLEVDDYKSFLISGLSGIKPFYVNSTNSKDFECIHQTVYGEFNMKTFSFTFIFELIDELMKHMRISYYIVDIAKNILFWRGSHKVSLFGKEFVLPVSSFTLFFMAVTLVEKPKLIPSYSFFSLASVMLISMSWRNNHPNPWYRCASFMRFSKVLTIGDALLKPEKIEAGQNADEGIKFDLEWKELIETAEKKAEERAKEVAQEQAELERELQELGGMEGEDISTNIGAGGLSNLNPLALKKYLLPVQQYLVMGCEYMRLLKNILLWEESIFSFWITFISLILSVVCLFIPWTFICTWTARLVAWSVFGPWMKLVDIYVLNKPKKEGAEETSAEELDRLGRKKLMEETLQETRKKNEIAFKLRDFKQYFFGKFLTKVPVWKSDRFNDIPLPSSTATPIKASRKADNKASVATLTQQDSEIVERDLGQRLVGMMISTLQGSDEILADEGKEADIVVKEDDPKDAVKIGGLVLGSAVVTYFLVPILMNIVVWMWRN